MHSRHFRIISFAFLMVAPVTASAATPPPAIPFNPHPWQNATLKQRPTNGIKMGALRVKFEKTTLSDVRKAASVGEIYNQGDAAESIYWLCYTNLRASPVERIWVIAHGEIGGSEHSVTSFRAEILPNGTATADCPALPANLTPMSLDNNLWLNSSENDALKRFGSPSYQNKSWRSYYYSNDKLDSGSWLWVQTESGQVTALHAGQVTGF